MERLRLGAIAAVSVSLAACGSEASTESKEQPAASGSAAAGRGPGSSGTLSAVQVAAGLKISFARMSDGTVRAWGNNDSGTLGDGKKGEDAATPVQVGGLADVVQIDTGSNGTGGTNVQIGCARLKDGAVKCWGTGSNPLPTEDRKELVTPTDIPELKGALQLSLGTNGHGCAVMGDKTVKCWGYNAFGEVGTGDTKPHYAPTAVAGLTGVEEVKAGHNHSCARVTGGAVKCWGWNSGNVVLPSAKDDKVLSPTDTGVTGATLLHAGTSSCAVVAEGLVCWGGSIDRSAKGSVEGTFKMEGTTDVIAIDGASDTTCALEKAGTVKCWGENKYGQLGSGQAGKTSYKAVAVSGVADAISVDVGTKHACVATKAGKVLCWGMNQRGEIGDGSLQDRPAPVEVKHALDKPLPPKKDGLGDVKESSVAQDWGTLPAGCKHSPTLELKADSLGLTGFDVKSAYATRSEKQVSLKLANYRQDPADLFWDEPRGKQVLVSVSFYKIDLEKKEAKALDLGSYDMDTKNERYATPGLRTAKKAFGIGNITLEGLKAGSVSLTHLGDDWVCGELAVQTKGETIKGSFAAKVVKN